MWVSDVVDPLLLLFGIWKHGVCRVPISYTPMLWSFVFRSACMHRQLGCRWPATHRCTRFR
jgi:hypothetical protein